MIKINMTKEIDPFAGLDSAENIPESNWAKFEKVGDFHKGYLVEVKDKPASGVFGPQRVFTLRQADGELIHVGIPLSKDYIIGRANTAKMGDKVGFKFVKEVPSATKGFAPAKSIEVYIEHVEGTDDVPFE